MALLKDNKALANLKRMPKKTKKIGVLILSVPILFVIYIIYGVITSSSGGGSDKQPSSYLENLKAKSTQVKEVSSDYMRLQKQNDKIEADAVINNGKVSGGHIDTPEVVDVQNTAFTKEEFLDGMNLSTENEKEEANQNPVTEAVKPEVKPEVKEEKVAEATPQDSGKSPLSNTKQNGVEENPSSPVSQSYKALSDPNYEKNLEAKRQAHKDEVARILGFSQAITKEWQKNRTAGTWVASYKPKDGKENGLPATNAVKGKSTKTTVDVGENRDKIGYKALMPGDKLLVRLGENVNSDYPSKITFIVTSGTLEGALIMGDYSASGDRPVINLSSITWNGKSSGFKGVITDPFKNQNYVEGDVDYHSFSRWSLLAVSLLTQGYSDALANSGSSTTTVGGISTTTKPKYTQDELLIQSAGALANKGADIAGSYFDTPPTVTVKENTIFGILVTEPMLEDWLPNIVKGKDVL